jgi:hypothetical protein
MKNEKVYKLNILFYRRRPRRESRSCRRSCGRRRRKGRRERRQGSPLFIN